MSVKAVLLTRDRLDDAALTRMVETPALGGVVTFLGVVRNDTDGVATEALIYEAYEERALAEMRRICEAAVGRWDANVAAAHRLGKLMPGEVSVVTAAACAHRAEAFACCQFLIDRIKADAPIWKKEALAEESER